ncbi:hypothetical protein HanRHA438_Chr02g0048281 [Helianthus annuus]|nr:hypothetical protein HanRHA438_Chr02g0048281 [Helianthus annuus]
MFKLWNVVFCFDYCNGDTSLHSGAGVILFLHACRPLGTLIWNLLSGKLEWSWIVALGRFLLLQC